MPDTATAEHLRGLQLHLTATGVQPPTINATVTVLRFFVKVPLDRPETARHLDSSPENRGQEESNNRSASGGKEIDDLLNGVVGAVVGGFKSARRLVGGGGAVMETAVGEGAAEPFVEEEEEQRYLDSFRREAVGVARAVTLQQAVDLELAEVVAELVQAVGIGGEVEAGEDGVVDLLGGPAANLSAAVQEDFEKADEACVVDLDPGIADRAE